MTSRNANVIVALLMLVALTPASAVLAQSPQTLSYQGRLTDDAGAPLDTVVDITFRLYQTEFGPTLVWTQTHPDVVVADGLFDVVLTLFGTDMGDTFDGTVRWLSVQVGSGPESDSRVRIGMVPYAHWAHFSDTAQFARAGAGMTEAEADTRYVRVEGDTIAGSLAFDSDPDPNSELITGTLSVGSDATNLRLYDNANHTSALWGDDYGELALYYPGHTFPDVDAAGSNNGGIVRLYDSTSTNTITLRAYGVGDNALQVPANAVNCVEILNEPGLASSINSSVIGLTTTMQDLETVTITTPASGYIRLTGRCWTQIYNSSLGGQVYGYIQIDETAGGSLLYPYYTTVGVNNSDNSLILNMPVYIDRIYYKPAGTYEFRLEGMKSPGSTASSYVTTLDHQLTAIYLPTAYDTVESIVAEPGDYPDPIVQPAGERPLGESGQTQFKVDLRYYELKAQAARQAAIEAECELDRARERQVNER
ncbi:MAG: hypothetical protein ABIE70_09665 [bacterium]